MGWLKQEIMPALMTAGGASAIVHSAPESWYSDAWSAVWVLVLAVRLAVLRAKELLPPASWHLCRPTLARGRWALEQAPLVAVRPR